jgi:hypothetical protein
MRLTQGSEPSQYLEEEKATAIPLVAASERGTAQTAFMLKLVCVVFAVLWGLTGSWHDMIKELQKAILVEYPGKDNQRR